MTFPSGDTVYASVPIHGPSYSASWIPLALYESVQELEGMYGNRGYDFVDILPKLKTVHGGGIIGIYYNALVFGYLVYTSYKRCITIRSLYVLEAYRKQGLGTLFVEFLFDNPIITGNNNRVKVVVPERNEHLVDFFKKRGFSGIGVARGYFSEDEDGFIMLRRVKE